MKAVMTLFLFCFVLGVGLTFMSPAPANADSTLSQCNTQCSDIVCGGGCDFPEYMHYRCYMFNFYPTQECTGPFNCGCRAIGCGGDCNQFIE